MPAYGLPPQIVMTTPLLEGLDGVEKMSKSLGNYVGMTDRRTKMFGKLMSISDDLMWRYYLLLTDLTSAEHRRLEGTGRLRPAPSEGGEGGPGAPHRLPSSTTPTRRRSAAAEFDRVHARGELPSELKEMAIDFGGEPTRTLSRIILDAGLAASTSEAARKIQQGGVRLNGERISDPRHRLGGDTLPATLQVGRQTVRLLRL